MCPAAYFRVFQTSACCECPTKRTVLRDIHCFNLNLSDNLAVSLHNILSTGLINYTTSRVLYISVNTQVRTDVIVCSNLSLPLYTRHSPHIYMRHSRQASSRVFGVLFWNLTCGPSSNSLFTDFAFRSSVNIHRYSSPNLFHVTSLPPCCNKRIPH